MLMPDRYLNGQLLAQVKRSPTHSDIRLKYMGLFRSFYELGGNHKSDCLENKTSTQQDLRCD